MSISAPTSHPHPRTPIFFYFKIWPESYKTTRSKSWVRSKVNVIRFTQYPTDAPPFRFTSIGPTIPEICPIECLTLKKHIRNFLRKFGKKRVSNRIPPKSYQVIGMIRSILLPSFVVIFWVVLTLSCRQGYFCLSMSQSWPWLLKRFWREKQKSLRRRRRTNWKHKVTPDLINSLTTEQSFLFKRAPIMTTREFELNSISTLFLLWEICTFYYGVMQKIIPSWIDKSQHHKRVILLACTHTMSHFIKSIAGDVYLT